MTLRGIPGSVTLRGRNGRSPLAQHRRRGGGGFSCTKTLSCKRGCQRHYWVWKHLGGDVAVQAPSRIAFTAFAHEVEPRLRYALVASCGTQRGVDATVDALEWAWEHWDKVEHARNPAGYLYRVARRRSLRDPSRTIPLLRANRPRPMTNHGLSPHWRELSTVSAPNSERRWYWWRGSGGPIRNWPPSWG